MNCETLAKMTAWPCRPIEGANGERGFVLAPPVAFWDGSVVPLYVFNRGNKVEITDDGCLLEHLDMSGFKVAGDKRRRQGLDEAMAKWSVDFSHELQVVCEPSEVQFALQRLVGALFAAVNWENTNSGRALDAGLLISEVEIYLRALQPEEAVSHDVKLTGLSGRTQVFPLRLGMTYYEAVSTHPTASAAMVKKLLDVHLVPENSKASITVVIDDRASVERAKADGQIYSQLAHVTRLSELQDRALRVLRPQ